MKTGLIVFAIVVLAIVILTVLYKNLIIKKLFSTLNNRDFEQYFTLLKKPYICCMFPVFNQLYMELNGHLLKGDNRNIERTFDKLIYIRKNKIQAKDVYIKAFNYYIQQNNKSKAYAVLEKIRSTLDARTVKYYERFYDIQMLRLSNHIDSMMEELFAEEDDFQKGMLAYMLALQYANANDRDNQIDYLKLARQHVDGTPFFAVIDYELKELLG